MSTTGAALALELEVEQTLPMPLSGSLRCGPGELVALVGPSGAGKTSMMRVLAGLMRPERGRVMVGQEVWCDTAQGIFNWEYHKGPPSELYFLLEPMPLDLAA